MAAPNFFIEHHTSISLVVGPVLAWGISKIPRVGVLVKVALFFVAMYLLVGLWGLILNAWLAPVIGAIIAVQRRRALGFLRYASLALAVILIAGALAFYAYLVYANPGEIFKNLANPLLLIYGVPGMLMLFVSGHIQELRAEAKGSA